MKFSKIIFAVFMFSFSIFLSGCTLDQTSNVEKIKRYPSGVFKTIDNGETWDSKSFVKKTENNRIISISDSLVYDINFSPISEDIVITTKNNGIYYSSNRAENWNPLFTIGKDVKAFSFDSSSESSYYVGYQNKLYKTDNYGLDWRVIYTDMDSTIVYVRSDYSYSKRIFLFLADGRILKTEDGGNSFRVVFNLSKIPLENETLKHDYSVDSVTPLGIKNVYFRENDTTSFYIITNDGSVYVTNNSGLSFEKLSLKNVVGLPKFLSFYPGAKSSFILVSDSGIFKTFDGGETFSKINMLTSRNRSVSALAVSPNNNNIMYYALGSIIYRTLNGGETWNTVFSPVTRTVSALKIDPSNLNVLYLGSDIDDRMIQESNDENMFCQIFGVLFPFFCNPIK